MKYNRFVADGGQNLGKTPPLPNQKKRSKKIITYLKSLRKGI